jgi:hypothetical protein
VTQAALTEPPAGLTGAQKTEYARRRARFTAARDRVTQIADGTPRLTDAELAALAGVLLSRCTPEYLAGAAGEAGGIENAA